MASAAPADELSARGLGFADDEEVLDKLRQKLRPRRGQSLLDFWNALTEEQLTGRLQKAGVEEFDLKADVEAVRAKLAEYPQVTSPLAPCYTKVLRIPRKWGPEIGTGAAVMDVVTDCVTAFKTLRKVSQRALCSRHDPGCALSAGWSWSSQKNRRL